MILNVKIIPNAARNQIESWKDDLLRVRIHAVPEKGKANEELISFLSKEFQIAKSRIKILSGHTGRMKRIELEKISPEEFVLMLNQVIL